MLFRIYRRLGHFGSMLLFGPKSPYFMSYVLMASSDVLVLLC